MRTTLWPTRATGTPPSSPVSTSVTGSTPSGTPRFHPGAGPEPHGSSPRRWPPTERTPTRRGRGTPRTCAKPPRATFPRVTMMSVSWRCARRSSRAPPRVARRRRTGARESAHSRSRVGARWLSGRSPWASAWARRCGGRRSCSARSSPPTRDGARGRGAWRSARASGSAGCSRRSWARRR